MLELNGAPYRLPSKEAVLTTFGKTFWVTCLSSAAGNWLIQPALANSAVQTTSMPTMSMVESLAAKRRTSCSRC